MKNATIAMKRSNENNNHMNEKPHQAETFVYLPSHAFALQLDLENLIQLNETFPSVFIPTLLFCHST